MALASNKWCQFSGKYSTFVFLYLLKLNKSLTVHSVKCLWSIIIKVFSGVHEFDLRTHCNNKIDGETTLRFVPINFETFT